MAVWKFRLENDFIYATGRPIKRDVEFRDKNGKLWGGITKSGIIIIKAGYAWDGCSPKFKFRDIIIGVPDGAPDPETGLPLTYFASLVHDFLYQFLDDPDMPWTREQIDKIFHDIMIDAGFYFADLYYDVVRHLGGVFHYLNNL